MCSQQQRNLERYILNNTIYWHFANFCCKYITLILISMTSTKAALSCFAEENTADTIFFQKFTSNISPFIRSPPCLFDVERKCLLQHTNKKSCHTTLSDNAHRSGYADLALSSSTSLRCALTNRVSLGVIRAAVSAAHLFYVLQSACARVRVFYL